MKKILFTLLLLVSCQMAFCQSASSVFNDFRDKKKVEFVTVPKLLLTVGAAKVKDSNLAALMKEVDEVKVITLNDCRKSIKKKFAKQITALSGNGYSDYTGYKGGKDKDMTILVKQSGQNIQEIVGLVQNSSKCMGILVSGNINSEDVAAILGVVDE